jgi:hypothetical protein
VYKRIKTLNIKNISSSPIYFRKKQIGNKIYLVSIVPSKIDKFTSIEKKQT